MSSVMVRGASTSQALQPRSLPPCHPGGRGWDIIIIISYWKQVCSSSPGHWGASFPIPGLLGAAGWQEQSHPLLRLCLLLQPRWSDLALLLTWAFESSKTQSCWCCSETSLRNPYVTLRVPCHKLPRQKVQGRNKTAFTFAFFLRNWQEIKRKLKHP